MKYTLSINRKARGRENGLACSCGANGETTMIFCWNILEREKERKKREERGRISLLTRGILRDTCFFEGKVHIRIPEVRRI